MFLNKFGNFFVNFVKKEGAFGSTSSAPSDLQLSLVVLIPKGMRLAWGLIYTIIFCISDPPDQLIMGIGISLIWSQTYIAVSL